MPSIATVFHDLSAQKRRVLQITALSGGRTTTDQIVEIYGASQQNTSLTSSQATKLVKQLTKQKLLFSSGYQAVLINSDYQALAVQDSIREGSFKQLTKLAEKLRRFCYGSEAIMNNRDALVAFFNGNVSEFQSITKLKHAGITPASMLDPFDRELFDALDPILQQMYLVDAASRVIRTGEGNREVIDLLGNAMEAPEKPDSELLAAAIDLYTVSGQVESLRKLDEQTNGKIAEIAACEAFLTGDYVRAESLFDQAMPLGKRRTGKSKTAMKHLPACWYLLLLLKGNSADTIAKATNLVASIGRASGGKYNGLLPMFQKTIEFRKSPRSAVRFSSDLKQSCTSTLATVLAGYFWNWCLAADEAPFKLPGLRAGMACYEKLGLSWLAAEMAGLAGRTDLKGASELASSSKQVHKSLGTKSVVGLVQPMSTWERALSAIEQLDAQVPGEAAKVDTQSDQRMIWEIFYSTKYGNLSLRPFLQKRNSKGWSKGRRVSLQRVFNGVNSEEFDCLTEQDREICRAMYAERSYDRYGDETEYYFDDVRTAQAIVGHPRIYCEGDRETPMEIVTVEPYLTIKKSKGKQLALELIPTPPKAGHDNGDEAVINITEEGPRRLSIVVFNSQHRKLHEILGGKLTVPAAAADRVMQSVGAVTALVSVHSEIDAVNVTTAAETLNGSTLAHVHLVPYHEGLRLKFYVRPFGDDGPFFVTGEGAATVVANIDNQSKSAHRNLKQELAQRSEIISACPEIAAQESAPDICFPSAVDALETLLQLDELAAQENVILHWPQGRSLQLAGQAAGTQLRVNIKRDRDWFAASGQLKVSKELSLDMMELVKLVEASPSRFVQLEDGRFLALASELRRRIDDLSTYSERSKGKLRFPASRATVLEDLCETVTVKADKHWQQCVQRMRTASEFTADLPSTLQAELRDYQQEGFQWLARLAEWGMGACLADDMGLGKTIQALALLLHRSSDGPALVVAPTSVGFNWLNEIVKFAPTLNAHWFGYGDRAEAFKDLGPRSVVICSYGLLHSEAKKLQSQAWHTVILDEAQAIKNVATKRSKAAMGLEADFRVIMTGTPLENHLGELWNLFQFINPGLLGSAESFQQRFAVPIERDGCADTRRRLQKLIQPFILRRTKSQVLQELPARTEITLHLDLSTEEAAFYEALRQRAVEKFAQDDAEQPQHLQILAELMRLRRACCHPDLVLDNSGIPSSKLALFSETLSELLDNKHKVLVFSQFVDHLSLIRQELEAKGISYQYLDGSTTAKQRRQRVEAFQSGDGDVFLISLKAGGLGLNLTAADYVIHMDPWWNPAVEDQASDRAHRMGQTRPVTIYRLVTKGTIEERITELHATKRDLADSLLEGTEMTGKLSAAELLKLIRSND